LLVHEVPKQQNLDYLRSQRRKVARSHGVVHSKKSAIEDMLELQAEHPYTIQSCDVTLNNFFISPKAHSITKFLNFKNNPVITDVTFSVFENYNLCSSVIYCKEFGRNVLIYAAVMAISKAT
jgi:hypothetical protein